MSCFNTVFVFLLLQIKTSAHAYKFAHAQKRLPADLVPGSVSRKAQTRIAMVVVVIGEFVVFQRS